MKPLRDSQIIGSFHEMDFRAIKVPVITVYERPADFPESFVARVYDLDQWTPYAMVKTSLEAIRKEIPNRFYRLERMVGDDPAILEVWI